MNQISEAEMLAKALTKWRALNRDKNKWATFECVRFPLETRAVVKCGTIHTDGTKEVAISSTVYSYRHTDHRFAENEIIHR